MLSRQGIFKILGLLLILTLFVVACERPLQSLGDGGEETPTATTGEGEPASAGESEGAEISGEATVDAGAVGTEGQTEEPTAQPQETPTEAVEEVEPTEEVDPTQEATAEPEDESPRAGEEGAAEGEEAAGEATEEPAQEAASEEAAEEAQEDGEEEAAAAEAEAAEVRTHVVQAGENLYRIGLQYGISWVVLAQYNNLPNANAIYSGQELRIPPSEEAAEESPTPTPAPTTETTYVVRPGDTLYRIGLMFDVSWVEIADANGIVNPNRILVGQELKIPTATPEPSPQLTHTVAPGESLFTISLRYGVPWTGIAEENDLTSPYVIYPGQTLAIPGG